MYEGCRWHDDKRFFSPMIVLSGGIHLFIGDFVKFEGNPTIYGKVVKFALQVRQVCIGYNVLIVQHVRNSQIK